MKKRPLTISNKDLPVGGISAVTGFIVAFCYTVRDGIVTAIWLSLLAGFLCATAGSVIACVIRENKENSRD